MSNLPRLDAPAVGTECLKCHREGSLIDPPFCAWCHDMEMQDLERRIRASELLIQAKQRTKAWMSGKAVSQ